MSLAFFRSSSNPDKKVTLNEQKSDLSLLWENHCSPMRKNNSAPLITKCVTPKKKLTSEDNFLNLLVASRPQTPTKKLFCPPRHNNLIPRSQSSGNNNNGESFNNSEFLYSRISITTDETFLLPDEIKEFVTYTYAPSINNRGDSEFQMEAWENFKNSNSRTSRCSVVSSAIFAFLFVNEDFQTKVHVKSFTGTAQQQILQIIHQDDNEEQDSDDEDSNSLAENGFLLIDYNKAIDLIESLCSKEKINIFSTDPFHYSIVMPLTFKYSEFESSQGKMFRVSLSGYIFPFQVKQLSNEKTQFNLFKTSKSVMY